MTTADVERPELHKLCGLKDKPTAGTQWHELITAGLPARGVQATAEAIGVTAEDLAELLGVPAEDLANGDAPLHRDVSNFLYRVALAFTRTLVKTGGDIEKAAKWLRNADPALKNYIPILFLQSHLGSEYVFAAIERMEAPKDKLIQHEEAPDAGTTEFEHNLEEDEEGGEGGEHDDEEDNPFARLRD
jgi:hypothetical protein